MNAITTDFTAGDQAGQSQSAPGSATIGHFWCVDPQALIATPEGLREACEMSAGDAITAAPGRPAIVRCSTEILLRHHPAYDQRLGWPLIIQPGAMGDLLPTSALRLPANACIAARGFAPTAASTLVNDATVTRTPPSTTGTIWRVLICEVAAGSRLTVSGLEILGTPFQPDDDTERAIQRLAVPNLPPAPPFDLPQGTGHAALRRMMADHALVLGHPRISDPGLFLLEGDQLLEPDCQGPWCRFTLTPGHTAPPHRVTLLSRHAIPAEIIGNNEKRRLGVAVSRIKIGGRAIELAHWALGAGWHEPEPGWRWTNGRAALLVPPTAREIAFEIANILPAYPLPQMTDIPLYRAMPR